jgi:large subunit ribosomal protein L30
MKLVIRQRRSAIGRGNVQQETIRALGIRRLGQSVVHQDSPQIRGMIQRVVHLVEVQETEGE